MPPSTLSTTFLRISVNKGHLGLGIRYITGRVGPGSLGGRDDRRADAVAAVDRQILGRVAVPTGARLERGIEGGAGTLVDGQAALADLDGIGEELALEGSVAERADQPHVDEQELARLRGEPWVRALTLDVSRGHPVEAFVNGRERVGEASIVAEGRDELDLRVEELRRRLALGVTP